MYYTKKPVTIEAHQLTEDNLVKMYEWVNGVVVTPSMNLYRLLKEEAALVNGLFIQTLEGNMLATFGDWVIRGVNGEFYPCKPDIFEKTYDNAKGVTDLGKVLRRFRALSQDSLVAMARTLDMATSELSAIETGRCTPTDEQLQKIACYLAGEDYKKHPFNPNDLW